MGKFPRGAKVRIKTERDQVGIILDDPRKIGGECWYRVFFGADNERNVPEGNLETYEGGRDVESLLMEKVCGTKETLSKIVTYTKLKNPLQNSIYSFHSSRTQFLAYQFKPLLKFLDSYKQRLLIADEVGLGKTIEAGLILVEQRARHPVDRVLIVCPSALCTKWREEMSRRFDENFTILDSKGFRGFLAELDRRGEAARLRGICSVQTLRGREVLEEIRAVSPPLDLVIVDEAHHMRNTGTLSYQLGMALSDCSDAMVLLTATPIHLGNENLFNILRILDPEEMDNFHLFQRRLKVNEHVISAQRLLRTSSGTNLSDAEKELRKVEGTEEKGRFLKNPFYLDVLQKLRTYDGSRKDHIVELQKDFSTLNLLAHIFTRTRKSEVDQKRPQRTAYIKKVELTPEEMDFYQKVTNYTIQKYQAGWNTLGGFTAIMVQRQMSSCIPAMVEHYANFEPGVIGGRESELSDLDVENWSELDSVQDKNSSSDIGEIQKIIRSANAVRVSRLDSKLKALLEILEELERTEKRRKVIVFSYFKKTLSYLKARLEESGYKCLVISGDVVSTPGNPDTDERKRIIDKFRDDPSSRVLLSSEVGSEGLDFQFCHILVNYDLPWNPMVVEQRIGRLDRIGQKSERIIIFNLSIPGTIEDRILRRLYQRIHIFEESIGDLEAILGDEIRNLTLALFGLTTRS